MCFAVQIALPNLLYCCLGLLYLKAFFLGFFSPLNGLVPIALLPFHCVQFLLYLFPPFAIHSVYFCWLVLIEVLDTLLEFFFFSIFTVCR